MFDEITQLGTNFNQETYFCIEFVCTHLGLRAFEYVDLYNLSRRALWKERGADWLVGFLLCGHVYSWVLKVRFFGLRSKLKDQWLTNCKYLFLGVGYLFPGHG